MLKTLSLDPPFSRIKSENKIAVFIHMYVIPDAAVVSLRVIAYSKFTAVKVSCRRTCE
jgi:hypothetical protein